MLHFSSISVAALSMVHQAALFTRWIEDCSSIKQVQHYLINVFPWGLRTLHIASMISFSVCADRDGDEDPG